MSTDVERTADIDFLQDRSEWVRTHPSGRVCGHPDCGTVLSVYNPGGLCSAHEAEPDWTYQGQGFRYCPVCDVVVKVRLKSQSGVAACKKCAAPPKAVPKTVQVVFPNKTYRMETK